MRAFKVASVIATNLENKSKIKELFMSLLKSKDDAEMPLIYDFDEFERTADAKMLTRLALDICDLRLEIDAVHSFEKNHCFMLLIGGTLGVGSDVAAFSTGLQKEIAVKLDNKKWSPIYSNSVEVLSAYRPVEELVVGSCSYCLASTGDVYADKESLPETSETNSKLYKAACDAMERYFGGYFDTDGFVL